jgi:putative flippase GtrA
MLNKVLTATVKNEVFIQATKYIAVAIVCTVLDFILLYILTKYMDVNYLISSVISFMSGTVLNYFLCTSYVFDIRVINKNHLEFIYYVIISAIGLGINTGVIWIITELFGIYYMVSKLVSLFFTFFWNYGARKYLLHTVR